MTAKKVPEIAKPRFISPLADYGESSLMRRSSMDQYPLDVYGFRVVKTSDGRGGEINFRICDTCGHWIRRVNVSKCFCKVDGCHGRPIKTAREMQAAARRSGVEGSTSQFLKAITKAVGDVTPAFDNFAKAVKIGNDRLRKLDAEVAKSDGRARRRAIEKAAQGHGELAEALSSPEPSSENHGNP